ncbi:hypothetical protein COTS27_00036 [Spirochaetota bacterium]|nr:hypothetical protein COTS27_00036 [Spirochaetota bacterium]
MLNLPFYTFLKLLVSIVSVSWSLLCVWEFTRPRSFNADLSEPPKRSPTRLLSFIKIILHGLTLGSLTLYIIFYALALKNFPLTNIAEGFIIIAWLLVTGFLLSALPPKARSIDAFLAPIPTVLLLIGTNFASTLHQTTPPVLTTFIPIDELVTTLILFSMINYFYVFIITMLYNQSFSEIKKKKTLFLTTRLPNLPTLNKIIETFLMLGTFIFVIVIIVYFSLMRTIAHSANSLTYYHLSLSYICAGGLFAVIFILVKLKRIGHVQLLLATSIGFVIILFYLFDIF